MFYTSREMDGWAVYNDVVSAVYWDNPIFCDDRSMPKMEKSDSLHVCVCVCVCVCVYVCVPIAFELWTQLLGQKGSVFA